MVGGKGESIIELKLDELIYFDQMLPYLSVGTCSSDGWSGMTAKESILEYGKR